MTNHFKAVFAEMKNTEDNESKLYLPSYLQGSGIGDKIKIELKEKTEEFVGFNQLTLSKRISLRWGL